MAGLKVSILGPKIVKIGVFRPSNLLGGTYGQWTYHAVWHSFAKSAQGRRKIGGRKNKKTRMWANAQRDGRPAEYGALCSNFNAAKFGARLGRKVNFVPGKIPLLGKNRRKCISAPAIETPNIVQSLVGFR